MSTRITAHNGTEIEVCELGLSVIDREDRRETWARLMPEQRRALVDALDPDRRGSWSLQDIARLRAYLANHPKPGSQPYAWGGVDPSEARQDADSLLYRAERAERERDEAVARAEQAENARDTVATRAGQLEKQFAASREAHRRSADAHMEWKARAEAAELRCERMEHEIECHSDGARRAQNALAEARRASAVSRADVVDAVNGSRRAGREPDDQGFVPIHPGEAIDHLCALFGIEAEQAVDPVEEQTDALADILYGDELVTHQMRGVLERVVRAGMLFPGQEATR